MRIVVNTLILGNEALNRCDFVYEMFTLIIGQQSQHQFVLLTASFNNRPLPHNVTVEVIPETQIGIASLLWWYNVKLPKILKKHKADVLVNGNGICSFLTTVPQVLLVQISGISFHPALSKSARFLLKLFTPAFFRKAAVITTISEYLRRKITSVYNIPLSKLINISYAASPIFKPLSWDERESIKERYSGGVEYFVFVNSIYSQRHLVGLLKAFSTFKKRQLTNMKLLITGNSAPGSNETFKKLKTYKFQSDVELACNLPVHQYAKVIAASYALICADDNEGFSLPVSEAIMCDVPVIASKSSMEDTGGDAVLYMNPVDTSDMAEQMKLIFKDEKLRMHLIEKGRLQAKNFSPGKPASLMWQAIIQATSK